MTRHRQHDGWHLRTTVGELFDIEPAQRARVIGDPESLLRVERETRRRLERTGGGNDCRAGRLRSRTGERLRLEHEQYRLVQTDDPQGTRGIEGDGGERIERR